MRQRHLGITAVESRASLIRDSAGNFYGTTAYGGASNWGVVFKLDTAGTETVLHSFTGGADGGYPLAGLIGDSAGNLYGTTQSVPPGCHSEFANVVEISTVRIRHRSIC